MVWFRCFWKIRELTVIQSVRSGYGFANVEEGFEGSKAIGVGMSEHYEMLAVAWPLICLAIGFVIGDRSRALAHVVIQRRFSKCSSNLCLETEGKDERSRGKDFPAVFLRRSVPVLAGGISYLGIALSCGPSLEAFQFFAFAAILLVLSFTDLEGFLIPNGCIAAAFAVRVIYLFAHAIADGAPSAIDLALYDGMSSFGVLFVLTVLLGIVNRLSGSSGMGGGDLKLFAVASFYFGWQVCIGIICLACIMGLLFYGVYWKRSCSGKREFPFGPSIALSVWIVIVSQANVLPGLALA